MENFCRKGVLFLIIPIVFFLVIENALPPTFFTFRGWEAFKVFGNNLSGAFYPNIQCKITEVGDLAPHAKYAIIKKIEWKTDKLGFRNNNYISNPNILIIGDSMVTGSSITQSNTLSNMLNRKTEKTVYNISPATINTLHQYKNAGIINPKNIVILAIVEREILSLPFLLPDSNLKSLKLTNPLLIKPMIWLDRLSSARALHYLKSKVNGSTQPSLQSKIEKKLFFCQDFTIMQSKNVKVSSKSNLLSQSNSTKELALDKGVYSKFATTDENINNVVKIIVQYKKYCNSIGCRFVFLPLPNKSTILWKMAGMKQQPIFLHKLDKKLRENRITTILSTDLFSSLVKKQIMPYHYDDTHWNKHAVNALTDKIIKLPVFRRVILNK